MDSKCDFSGILITIICTLLQVVKCFRKFDLALSLQLNDFCPRSTNEDTGPRKINRLLKHTQRMAESKRNPGFLTSRLLIVLLCQYIPGPPIIIVPWVCTENAHSQASPQQILICSSGAEESNLTTSATLEMPLITDLFHSAPWDTRVTCQPPSGSTLTQTMHNRATPKKTPPA